ncbi:MAG TPA: hypothetical protein EYG67_03035 [Campylobacterales bacterium]|nr:hypothetical protein [Campylobacterales bacterium]HIP42102.1 hypothetical protein [Campylobacterales bacterium]
MHGKIINYNPKKGYGFIYSEVHKENIFVHHVDYCGTSWSDLWILRVD